MKQTIQTRRAFFGNAMSAAAFAAVSGCLKRPDGLAGDAAPMLKVGVLSDIHLLTANDSMHGDVAFEKALRFYGAKKADAVLLCGDIADCGLVAELEYAAQIWDRVFPGGRRSDGAPVARLFHLGDHDLGGYAHKYSWAARCSKDPDEVNHALVNEDLGAIWERLFHEKWAPFQTRTVKGYTFVLAHHPFNRMNGSVAPGLAEALASAKPDPGRPFFYSMHRPVHATLPDWDEADLAREENHKVLSAYPNVIAFFGHAHRSAVDELSLWQGAYTAVHVPSTSYCCTRTGRENSFTAGDSPSPDRPQQMPRVDVSQSQQILFMDVYADRIVIARRDIAHDAPLGDDWVIPLPSPDGSCSAGARAAKAKAPAFPPGAAAEVCAVRGKNRARQLCDQVVVSFPPANSCGDRPRAFDYEVTVESDGRTLLVRRVFSTRAYWAEALDTEPVRCVFGRSELPEGRSVTFMVRPVNDYGRLGAPLPSVTFVV